MTESMSSREEYKQTIQQIESDYLSAIASAKKDRETSVKQAMDIEKQAVHKAREVIARGKKRFEDSRDRIESSIRQHDLREITKAQEKAVSEAAVTRAKAISQAAEAEKKALNAAKENRKEAISQADVAQKQAGKERKTSAHDNKGKEIQSKERATIKETASTKLNKIEDKHPQKAKAVETITVKESTKTESVKPIPVSEPNSVKSSLPDTTRRDRITLDFTGIVNAEQINSLENSLRQWPDIKLLMVSGSSKDIQMVVSASTPVSLSDKLKTLPMVENTLPAKDHIQIKLKSPSAK
jgi:hypothetical protein